MSNDPLVEPSSPPAQPPERRRRPRWRRWALATLAALAAVVCAALFTLTYVSPHTRYERALRALGSDDFDRARYELLRLEVLPEYEPHASLISGILLLREQKPEQALEELSLATVHPDTRVLALTLAGQTLYQRHNFHAAERALLEAVKADPRKAEAHRWLGVAYFDVGDTSRAEVHLRQAAELAPDDARPPRILGLIHKDLHDVEGAIRHYQESLRRDAGRPGQFKPADRQELMTELAECQVRLLRYQDALDTLQSVNDTPDTLVIVAECHQGLGDAARQRECLDRALALQPDHLAALLARGRLALDSNEPDAAIEFLDRALERHARDESVHYLLSQAHHLLGHEELAERHKKSFEELRELGEEYAQLVERAMRQPKQPDVIFQLGLAAERIDMPEAAVNWYRVTLSLDPRHAGAQGRLLQLAGAAAGGPGEPP
ncbi:MAG TPA: tetratricopeptide repeat protein [Pirellulales bacterium]|jgi:tetratricopeptide (TPR) repeat protein|nr:tetratricopeptide repeat protein [Pirellulales bacterium]